jgi:hypothetical protein
MAGTVHHRWSAMLALAGTVIVMCVAFLFASAPKAEAGLSAYCNNIVYGAWGACWGAQRNHYATYGWGDDHSVCVWSSWNYGGGPSTSSACSSGPGVGVYNPYATTYNFYPAINNNAAGNNRLHGVAYQP